MSLSTDFLRFCRPVSTFSVDRGWDHVYRLRFEHPIKRSSFDVMVDSRMVLQSQNQAHLYLLSDSATSIWYQDFSSNGYVITEFEELQLIQGEE